jgi:autotransporter-associated beta strand protein
MKRPVAVMVCLLLAAGAAEAQTDIVTNGGFETGDLSGWSGSTSSLAVNSAQPHSGTYAVKVNNGALDNNILQMLTTTTGQYYDLSFWLRGTPGATSSLTAYWGGSEIWSEADINHAYRQGTSGPLLASADSTELKFAFTDQSSLGRPFYFDDVSVQVYEPTNGTWISPTGGNWTNASNWQDGKIANGPGGTAYLNCDPAAPGPARVKLNGDRTIGHLEFQNSPTGEWALGTATDTGTLTLATPVGDTPSIRTDSNADIHRSIAGTQGFIKSGDGTLSLYDDSSYAGITDVTQGTVEIRSDNALGAASLGNQTIIRDGASLSVGANVHTPESLTISGNGVSGNGAVTLHDGSSLDGDISLDGDARIRQWGGTGTISGNIALTGSDVLNLYVGDGKTLDVTGSLSGAGRLLINHAGTVNLTADNPDFHGNVTLSDGTLNTEQMGVGAHGNGTFRNTGGTHVMNDNLYVGRYADGTGTYKLSGTGELTAPNVYIGNRGDGTLEQTGGDAHVTHNMYLGLQPAGQGTYNLSDGTMTIDNSLYIGGSATAAGGQGTVNLLGGQLTVNGTVKTWDGGTLNLKGGTLTTPTFAVGGGTLGGRGTIHGSVTVGEGGLVSPGNSPGLLTIDGDYTQDPLATLEMELGGLTRGDEYDALDVTGTMNLAGTLDVVLYGGFEPLAGNSFDILDWGDIAGAFDAVNLPTLTGGLYWDTSELYTDGTLNVVPIPGAVILGALGLATAARMLRKRS